MTLTRAADLIFAGNNSQRPSAVEVGDFDCVGKTGVKAMTDVAVAKDGKLFGRVGQERAAIC